MTERVTIVIQRSLDSLSSPPSKPSIFRVDSHLRSSGCENVYEPEILSIGPYHHGIPRLQNMEQHKLRYVKRLLNRRNGQTVDGYVKAVKALAVEAMKCYAEPLNVDEDAFVRIMVVDGLFLIELFRYCAWKNLRDKDDPIFRHERILSQLRHDVVLLENQLPFFVLSQLFHMSKTDGNTDEEEDLVPLFLSFVDGMFLTSSLSQVWERLPAKNFDHLCGLMHDAWCLPFSEVISRGCGYAVRKTNSEMDNWNNIKSACGLLEVGIKFRKATGSDNLMDIKFVNGVLRIPQLSIFDETESQFRNLIAYEQYLPDGECRYVSDYVFFMHCLINSTNDVELLRGRGIIENCVGSDEEVCSIFNRLGRNILTSSRFSYSYSQVFNSVNEHSCHRVKKWRANLSRNYFNSPWSILKLLAAIALLLLAFTQTTYTVLTYYNRNR